MSAIFPHRAVTERYLHTGGTRSSRKAVIAAFVGGVACAVVVANLPAGTLTSGATTTGPEAALKRTDGCKERTWPYNRCIDAAPSEAEKTRSRTVSTDQPAPAASPAPVVTAAADARSTTGVSPTAHQPNSRPQAETVAIAPTPQRAPKPEPVHPVAASEPPVVAPAPVATAAPVAPVTPPAAATTPASVVAAVASPPAVPPAASIPAATQPAAEPRKVATADDEDDDAPVKKATPKKIHKANLKQQRRAEAQARIAARRAEARARSASASPFAEPPATQPSYVRVIDLPNGGRVYQRLRGDQAAAMGYGPQARRSFFGGGNFD